MIPSRPRPPPAPAETIPARLTRLRREQRQGARCRAAGTSGTSSSSSSSSAQQRHSALALLHLSAMRPARAPAGPPAPKSWLEASTHERLQRFGSRSTMQRAPSGGNKASVAALKAQQSIRAKLLQPLEEEISDIVSSSSPLTAVPTLVCTCAHLIVADLALSPRRSYTLPFIHLLPNHLRLDMFECASTSGYGLEERAIIELLRPSVSAEVEVACAELDAETQPMEEEEQAWVNEGDWESIDVVSCTSTRPPSPNSLAALQNFPFHSLTSLNLAFSPITLPFLRSLLLSDRSIPFFPYLHTLNLTFTPQIPFFDSFFSLLSSLISLRHLSLSGKQIELHDTMMTPSSFLSRLAASTPTLVELDLSYVNVSPTLLASVIDWGKRWLDLIKLGLRNEPRLVGESREKVLKELRESIERKGGKTRKRKWVEIYV